MNYMNRPRDYARNLSEAERLAVLDRNEYEPCTPYPGHPGDHWLARCRLCGKEVTVVLNNLVQQDDWRQWRRKYGNESLRRERCSHSGGNRGPRPLGPLRHEEARALLKLIGEIEEPKAHTTLGRALKKIRRIAGST